MNPNHETYDAMFSDAILTDFYFVPYKTFLKAQSINDSSCIYQESNSRSIITRSVTFFDNSFALIYICFYKIYSSNNNTSYNPVCVSNKSNIIIIILLPKKYSFYLHLYYNSYIFTTFHSILLLLEREK